MITRVVKMTFRNDKQVAFEEVFELMHTEIKAFEGCLSVELLRDAADPSVYFTISKWKSAYYLEQYRSSEFFKTTWAEVKTMFAEKARAWTLNPLKIV